VDTSHCRAGDCVGRDMDAPASGGTDLDRDPRAPEAPERTNADLADAFPRASPPRILIGCVASLWLGAVILESTDLVDVARGALGADLAPTVSLLALVFAVGAATLSALAWRNENHANRSTSRMISARLSIVVALTLLASGGLGVAMRLQQAARERDRVELVPPSIKFGGHAASAPAITALEGTVDEGFAPHGFATDILARHFDKEIRWRAVLRDVVFVGGDGVRTSVDGADDDGSRVASRIAVFVAGAPPPWTVADRVRVLGVLSTPRDVGNPGDRDPRSLAARSGVVGFLSVESSELCGFVEGYVPQRPVSDFMLRLRDRIRSALRTGLLAGIDSDETKQAGRPGDGVGAMLVALVLGDSEAGYAAIENGFRAVGLAHILAISGFNLAVLGWMVAFVARIVFRSDRWAAACVAITAILALVLMAPAPSASRSALMAIVGAIGVLLRRDWNGDAILALAAACMVVDEPSVASNAGFQLSFACVIGLRHLSSRIRSVWLGWIPRDDATSTRHAWLGLSGEVVGRTVAAGIAAFVASAPIALAHFGSIQPLALVLSLVCSPISAATLVVAYPKAVIGAVFPACAEPIGPVLRLLVELQIGLVDAALSISGGAWTIAGWSSTGAALRITLCLALGASAIVSLTDHRRTVRAFGVIAFIATATCIHPAVDLARGETAPPRMALVTLAIGDGSAHLLEIGERSVVFDVGSSSTGGVASRGALPWALGRGGCIDALIVSHPDLDHYSGAVDLIRFARIKRLIVHDSLLDAAARSAPVAELLEAARDQGTCIETVAMGDRVDFGDAIGDVLWPPRGFRSTRDNDASIVLRIDTTHAPVAPSTIGDARGSVEEVATPRVGSLLLTGDIETVPAVRLLAEGSAGGPMPRSDVVELPHHGSWREAIVPFLARCDPLLVVQSTARRRWQTDRYGGSLPPGAMRHVTCRDGALRVEFHDGWILRFTHDFDVSGGWRPAGRWRIGARRIRRWEHAGSIRAWSRGSTLAWSDQRRALEHNPVAGNAVTAVADGDGDTGLRIPARAEGEGLATAGAIEHDAIACRSAEGDDDLDAYVGWTGLGDRNQAGEYRLCDAKSIRNLKRDRGGAINLDLGTTEEEAGRITKTRGSIGSIAIAKVGGGARHARATDSEWKKTVAIKYSREGIGGLIVGGWLRPNPAQPVGAEREAPTHRRTEGEILGANDGAIGGPDVDPGSRIHGHVGERERCDPLHRDIPVLYIPIAVAVIATCFIAYRRTLRTLLWSRFLDALLVALRRIGLTIGGRATHRIERRYLEFLGDRIDKAADDVAIQQQDGVGFGRSGRTAIGDHAKRCDTIEGHGDRSDPSVIPDGTSVGDAERSRQSLTVVRIDHTKRERSNLKQGSLCTSSRLGIGAEGGSEGTASHDERDCIVARDALRSDSSARSNRKSPAVGIEGLDSTDTPGPIGEKQADGRNAAADLGRRGLRCRTDRLVRVRISTAEHLCWSLLENDTILGKHGSPGERRHDGCTDDKHEPGRATSLLTQNLRRTSRSVMPANEIGHPHRARRFPRSWLQRVWHEGGLSLEDREIALRHLKDDQSHRRSICIANLLVGPRAVRVLLCEEFLADRRPPGLPALATREVHRLDRVVVPVEIVRLREPAPHGARAARESVAREIVKSTIDRFVLVDASIEETRNTGRGSRPKRSTDILHVSKPTVVVLARAHVSNGIIDRRLRNLDASVARAAKRHDLADGDRNVGIRRHRVVTPTTLVVLAAHDELHGADERVADPVILLIHPVDLTEEERRESMSIHGTMHVVRDDETSLARMPENEVERLLNAIAELATTRHIAVRHQGDGAETRDASVIAEATLAERALGLLDPSEVFKAPLDRLIQFRRDLLRKRCVLSSAIRRRPISRARRLLGRLRGLLGRRGLRLVPWPRGICLKSLGQRRRSGHCTRVEIRRHVRRRRYGCEFTRTRSPPGGTHPSCDEGNEEAGWTKATQRQVRRRGHLLASSARRR